MNDNWRAGDLALCISDAPCPVRGHASPYREGRTYVVTNYREGHDDYGRPAAGIKTAHCQSRWWNVVAFRKLGRHVADAEDRETIRLLTRKTVPLDRIATAQEEIRKALAEIERAA